MRLLGRTLGATIGVTTSTSTDAGMAFADPAALEAAVLNVALNARDAMPDGGSLAIHTSTVKITEPKDFEDDLEPGLYVRIALEDSGSGMPPDVVARVFEPFFTTKAGGRGTGLGLSMVYGFAKQSGGTVKIASEVGRGTTVSLFLPLAGSELQTPAMNTAPVTPSAAPRTILVVEDEADVRAIVRRQLESLGHRVLAVEAATEALLLIQGPGAPDVLLTDVVLKTGMSGVDLAQAAREARPGLPRDLHVGLHHGPGSAEADPRHRRAAAVQAVHHAATRARRERGLRVTPLGITLRSRPRLPLRPAPSFLNHRVTEPEIGAHAADPNASHVAHRRPTRASKAVGTQAMTHSRACVPTAFRSALPPEAACDAFGSCVLVPRWLVRTGARPRRSVRLKPDLINACRPVVAASVHAVSRSARYGKNGLQETRISVSIGTVSTARSPLGLSVPSCTTSNDEGRGWLPYTSSSIGNGQRDVREGEHLAWPGEPERSRRDLGPVRPGSSARRRRANSDRRWSPATARSAATSCR